MTFRFNIGTHRARPLYWLHWFAWLIKPAVIRRTVIFSQESKYDLQSEDQQDWNKLFGISFSINPHKQSARFGWRYNPRSNKFELSYYVHRPDGPEYDLIAELTPNWPYECEIMLLDTDYVFQVINLSTGQKISATAIPKEHTRRSGYLLGPYFGGNMTAPKKIIIELKKINK